jgi:hypothetical protein
MTEDEQLAHALAMSEVEYHHPAPAPRPRTEEYFCYTCKNSFAVEDDYISHLGSCEDDVEDFDDFGDL